MKKFTACIFITFIFLSCPLFASTDEPVGIADLDQPAPSVAVLHMTAYKDKELSANTASMRFMSNFDGTMVETSSSGGETGAVDLKVNMLNGFLDQLYTSRGVALGTFEAKGSIRKATATLTIDVSLYDATGVTTDPVSGEIRITETGTEPIKNLNSLVLKNGNDRSQQIPIRIERSIGDRTVFQNGQPVTDSGVSITNSENRTAGRNTVTVRNRENTLYDWLYRENLVLKIDSGKMSRSEFENSMKAGLYAGVVRVTATFSVE